jgi:hypothetical protein
MLESGNPPDKWEELLKNAGDETHRLKSTVERYKSTWHIVDSTETK